jgi:hypothetical protein
MARASELGTMGELAADPAMDIWAAGIIAYELLTGIAHTVDNHTELQWLIRYKDPLTHRKCGLAAIANAACRRIPAARIMEPVISAKQEHQHEEQRHDEQKRQHRRVRSV